LAIGVRRITNIGSKKVIGKFPSIKMNTIIWWESQIERDYIYLLEIDPNVESYKGQPFKIHYTLRGSCRSYTPDFWVIRPDRQQVIEVKPASKVNDASNIDKWRHIAVWCEEQNMEFMVVTDVMIRQQPKLDNIKLLYKYARTPLTIQNYLEFQKYFISVSSIPLNEACLDLKKLGIEKSILFKLLYFGLIEIDLMQPITANSLIKLSPNPGNFKSLIS
jgi:hypothetical protein